MCTDYRRFKGYDAMREEFLYIRRYLKEVPLSADERSILEGDAAKIEGFITKLSHIATPNGRTPDEIINGASQVSVDIPR